MEFMESIVVKKHKVYKRDLVKTPVEKIVPSDYLIRLEQLYNQRLSSGYDGRTCIFNYQGLVALAQTHYAPHPDIVPLRAIDEKNRTSVQKKCMAAYGYLILTNNVQSW